MTTELHDTEPARPPGWQQLALEARAPFEFMASMAAAPWLLRSPRGDGHPVIVYPGLLASDASTRPLRTLLAHLGHDVHGWGQGRNMGPRQGVLERAAQQIDELYRREARAVSLVGWSLGGVYARELAKRAGSAVRSVVTLGSPFAGPAQATHASRTYRWLQRGRSAASMPVDRLREAPAVPTTSIYSRSDGIVAWRCSVERTGALSENIEVVASHMGLGVNPLALHALADRLAQPQGGWRPFERHGVRRFLYTDPTATAATPPQEVGR